MADWNQMVPTETTRQRQQDLTPLAWELISILLKCTIGFIWNFAAESRKLYTGREGSEYRVVPESTVFYTYLESKFFNFNYVSAVIF